MRIVIATGIFPPDIGGPATSVSMLADAWTRQGHRVTVVTYADRETGEGKPYGVVRVPRGLPAPLRYARFFLEVRKALKEGDVVFAQDAVASGLPAALAARLLGRRFVLKIVGDFAWEHAQVRGAFYGTLDEFQKKNGGPLGIRLMRFIQRRVARRAGRVIVPSRYLAGIAGGWGVPDARLRVIYNGVHAADVAAAEDRRPHRIVVAQRLTPWKHIDVLIKAMATVLQRVPDAELLIVGDGPEEQRLKALASAPMLERKVSFAGRVPQDEVCRLLKASGVHALVSSYEGFSHQLVTGFMCGAPTVASRAGGNVELVEDGRNGLLVEVGDAEGTAKALIRMLEDRVFAERCVSEAKKDLSRFSIETQLRETTEEVIGDAKTRVVLVSRDPDAADPSSKTAERLRAYASRVDGMEVVAFGRYVSSPSADVRGYRARMVDSRLGPFSLWNLCREVRAAAADSGASLIVAQDPFEAGLAAAWAAHGAGIPYAIEDHGAFFAGDVWERESLLNRLRSVVGRHIAKRAASVRAVSARAAETYVKMGVRGEVSVVPVAIDLPARPVEAHRGPFTVLYAGRFSPEKNLGALLEAFSHLRRGVPDARLLLVGAGPEERRLRERTAELGIAAAVTWRPWSDDPAAAFREADVAALPSLREGYGRFAAEALANGVPLVMTDVGLAGDLVRDGVDGLIVPPGDMRAFSEALYALAKDPMRREMIRAAALRRASTLRTREQIAEAVTDGWKRAAS